jgi:hypothetical protein
MFFKTCLALILLLLTIPVFDALAVNIAAVPINHQPAEPQKEKESKFIPIYAVLSRRIFIPGEDEKPDNKPPKK